MPRLDISIIPRASRGSVARSTKLRRISSSIVTTTPPISSMGALTPRRCMRPSVWLTLYVSLVRREMRLGTVSASSWRAERRSIFSYKSCRIRLVASRDMADALRLAITFPSRAITAQHAMPAPQMKIAVLLPVGTTSSIMWASIHGMARSIMVPASLMINPISICPYNGRRYSMIFFNCPTPLHVRYIPLHEGLCAP